MERRAKAAARTPFSLIEMALRDSSRARPFWLCAADDDCEIPATIAKRWISAGVFLERR